MTRVLGDTELDSIINRQPEIYSVPLGSFLLVGSDGLFDPTHRTSVAEQAAHLAECIFDGKDAKGYRRRDRTGARQRYGSPVDAGPKNGRSNG